MTPYIQQYYKRYTSIYRLLYSVLDIVGREKLLYTVLHIAGRDFYPFCHMTVYYSSTYTNNSLRTMVWCYFLFLGLFRSGEHYAPYTLSNILPRPLDNEMYEIDTIIKLHHFVIKLHSKAKRVSLHSKRFFPN